MFVVDRKICSFVFSNLVFDYPMDSTFIIKNVFPMYKNFQNNQASSLRGTPLRKAPFFFSLTLAISVYQVNKKHLGVQEPIETTQILWKVEEGPSFQFLSYRVSHIEMSESKWFWGVEGSIILLIFHWRHVQQQWTFEFHQSIFT